MLPFEFRALLQTSNWPIKAVAEGARIPEKKFAAFMDGTGDLSRDELANLMSWKDQHTGITSTGKVMIDVYKPRVVMSPVISPDATTLPRGPVYDPFGAPPVVKVIDEKETRDRVAEYVGGTGSNAGITGAGVAITAQKVKEGAQVLKPKKAAA